MEGSKQEVPKHSPSSLHPGLFKSSVSDYPKERRRVKFISECTRTCTEAKLKNKDYRAVSGGGKAGLHHS